jgi:hypothetical protein
MSHSQTEGGFTGYQKLVAAVMAFLQFSIILDFTVMSPLGAMLIAGSPDHALAIRTRGVGLCLQCWRFRDCGGGVC